MRSRLLAATSALAVFSAVPAAAQISADIHIGPYGGRPVYVREPIREVVVVPSDRYRDGDYRDYYDQWSPVTVYVLGSRYYAQPYRNARPVVVYRYRDRYFFEPRDRGWVDYRSRYQSRDALQRRAEQERRERYERERILRERYERDRRYDRDRDGRDDRYERDNDRRGSVYQAPGNSGRARAKAPGQNKSRGKGRN